MLPFLNQLEKEPNIGPFLEPVDWKALGLQDYPKIVKKPMDLRTIREKVKQGGYANFDMFYADVQLVWNNCKSYNIAESEIYRMAEDLERTSKKMYKKMISSTKKKRDEKEEKSQEEDEEDDEGDISFDERIKFTDYVRKLTIEQMTTLVKMIQDTSPGVLEDLDTDKLQIKVNDISKDHFEKYMSYVQNWSTKENKAKSGSVAEEENSKSNNEEQDEPMSSQTKVAEKTVKKEENDDEEAKNSDDSSKKYGPEGKRFKSE